VKSPAHIIPTDSFGKPWSVTTIQTEGGGTIKTTAAEEKVLGKYSLISFFACQIAASQFLLASN